MAKSFSYPEVYDAFRHPPKESSQIKCTQEEKRTVEASEETDLNKMLRHLNPGMGLPVFGGKEPVYADVSEIGDYRSALEIVERGEEAFAAQPADIRTRFENNPALFLDFLMSPGNRDEAVKLGLIELEPADRPAVAPPAGGGGQGA